MANRVAINHKSVYRYDRLAKLSPHTLRLRTALYTRTLIHSYSLKLYPDSHFINRQQDSFSNVFARLVFSKITRKCSVKVDLLAEMVEKNRFDFSMDETANLYPFLYDEQLTNETAPYLIIKEIGFHTSKERKYRQPCIVPCSTRCHLHSVISMWHNNNSSAEYRCCN